MQTRLEFDPTNTLQEWGLFKAMLNQSKGTEKQLLKNDVRKENLVYHLTRQLDAGGLFKGL